MPVFVLGALVELGAPIELVGLGALVELGAPVELVGLGALVELEVLGPLVGLGALVELAVSAVSTAEADRVGTDNEARLRASDAAVVPGGPIASIRPLPVKARPPTTAPATRRRTTVIENRTAREELDVRTAPPPRPHGDSLAAYRTR
ncbi:MAG TPA: hypothetical protein VIX85_09780 [Acidimicrobiales bacterium]